MEETMTGDEFQARLAALSRDVKGLPRLSPLKRAAEARRLQAESRWLLALAVDEAVEEATRSATYAQVAKELGVSEAAVNKAVSRWRRVVAQTPKE